MWETGRSSEVLADTVGTSKDGDLARSNISLGSSGVMGVMSLTWRFRQGNFSVKGGWCAHHDHGMHEVRYGPVYVYVQW